MPKTTVAILYDFDKTLCTTDMQEYDFIKNLGLTPSEFWGHAKQLTEKHEMDKILAYMLAMVLESKEKNIPLTKEYLHECGKNVVLYRGVSSWFDRINEYGNSIGVNIEHYIISSGITEIIEGTPIAKYFKKIYGCSFCYDENGQACWPAMAINFTLKTQFIFRISKGVLDIKNDDSLNKHSDERRIEYRNMIYIGDGLTDIPCMKLIREKGGRAIALYPSGQRDRVIQLVQDNRINTVCVSDYSKDSTLEKLVKLMVENMALINVLNSKEERQLAQTRKLVQDNYEN